MDNRVSVGRVHGDDLFQVVFPQCVNPGKRLRPHLDIRLHRVEFDDLIRIMHPYFNLIIAQCHNRMRPYFINPACLLAQDHHSFTGNIPHVLWLRRGLEGNPTIILHPGLRLP